MSLLDARAYLRPSLSVLLLPFVLVSIPVPTIESSSTRLSSASRRLAFTPYIRLNGTKAQTPVSYAEDL